MYVRVFEYLSLLVERTLLLNLFLLRATLTTRRPTRFNVEHAAQTALVARLLMHLSLRPSTLSLRSFFFLLSFSLPLSLFLLLSFSSRRAAIIKRMNIGNIRDLLLFEDSSLARSSPNESFPCIYKPAHVHPSSQHSHRV